ncbi:MAG TPA: hypothetical protein VL243_04235 [Vicinamibacterales bacterium]|jgi:hypothetical protein|nr:hypothetical protein [Vicinamibacterales bacterium]
MPATPFHFGPGLLVKAAAPRQFSMAAYSLAQVVIDLESGYHLLRNDYPVHRQAHTFYLGGLIGLVCGLVVSRVGTWLARPRDVVPEALAAEYRLPIAAWSGIFGGLLHSVLDGIMHADMRPFRPFTAANPLYGLVSLRILYLFCIITGLVGAALLLARERRARRL